MQQKEPVALADAGKAFIISAIQLIVVLGIWQPTADQLAAVTLVVGNLAIFVGAYLTRRTVWSPFSVATAVEGQDRP